YWGNNNWAALGTDEIGPVSNPLPAPINPPYPVSADGSTLTGSGSLTTADGVWTIVGGFVYLNGVSILGAGGAENPFSVNRLQVDAHGQMFKLDPSSAWTVWTGYQWNPSTGPVSGPIPVGITITRSSV